MIQKFDILDRAREWQLGAQMVEKDYVLGWLLAGFGVHSKTGHHWVFKGGTCLKKCFFETYRFSEDIDFTLLESAAYEKDTIEAAIREVVAWTAHESGIEFPGDIEVRPSQDLSGRLTFEGCISYRGPLAPGGDLPRVRLDLSKHERVVLPPKPRKIFHPYPDTLPKDCIILTYAIEELLAEKTRALFERARPRDLYDVVHLLRHKRGEINFSRTLHVLREKCRFKSMVVPAVHQITSGPHVEELRADWEHMLRHQLPQLPPFDLIWRQLPALLAWVEERVIPAPVLTPYRMEGGERAAPIPAHVSVWGFGFPLELVRFAGSNRLCVQLTYHGRTRLVEPYSLRTPKTGNLLLYGWEREAGHIKAYKVSEIQSVKASDTLFTPRYTVEL